MNKIKPKKSRSKKIKLESLFFKCQHILMVKYENRHNIKIPLNIITKVWSSPQDNLYKCTCGRHLCNFQPHLLVSVLYTFTKAIKNAYWESSGRIFTLDNIFTYSGC